MGISKVFSAIPEMAGKYKIMSHRKIMKSCLSFGEDLTRLAKENGGHLTIEQLNKACEKVLPKDLSVNIVSDRKVAEQFLKGMDFGEDTISLTTNNSQSLVIKNLKGESLFFLPIEEFAGDTAVNLATHELEHLMDKNVSLQGRIQNFIMKRNGVQKGSKKALSAPEIENKNPMNLQCNAIVDKSKINNPFADETSQKSRREILNASEAASKTTMDLQIDLIGKKLGICDPFIGTTKQKADAKGLLEYMRLPSQHRLDVQLRQSVRSLLQPEAELQNVQILALLKMAIVDEARAYHVGGQTAHKYLGLTEGSTMSEMTAKLYDETVRIIKKEINAQCKKYIKRSQGIKVRNYEGKAKQTIFQ